MSFYCPRCHARKQGTPEQHRTSHRTAAAPDSKQGLERAAFDPTMMRVPRECDGCGRKYMTLVRHGDEEIEYTCVCRYAPAQAAPPEAAP